MSRVLEQACQYWPYVEPLLRKPANEADYQALVEILNQLLDMVGDDEQHPVAGLITRIGDNLEAYEAVHYPVPPATPAQMLRYLMGEHGLNPDDLPEVAEATVIVDLLSGKRQLTRKQIRALSAHFGVPAAVFL